MKGINRDGTPSKFRQSNYKQWAHLLDAPFIISAKCCEIMKEAPLEKHRKGRFYAYTGLIPGSYAVREVQPPNNFTLTETNTQHAFLQPDGHSIVEIVFANDPYGSLLISKRCEVTGRPLQNAEFMVRSSLFASRCSVVRS